MLVGEAIANPMIRGTFAHLWTMDLTAQGIKCPMRL